jgi:hypothetical protein
MSQSTVHSPQSHCSCIELNVSDGLRPLMDLWFLGYQWLLLLCSLCKNLVTLSNNYEKRWMLEGFLLLAFNADQHKGPLYCPHLSTLSIVVLHTCLCPRATIIPMRGFPIKVQHSEWIFINRKIRGRERERALVQWARSHNCACCCWLSASR